LIDPLKHPKAIRQAKRFAHCAHAMKGHTQWLGFLDNDEFINPRETFRSALASLPPKVD